MYSAHKQFLSKHLLLACVLSSATSTTIFAQREWSAIGRHEFSDWAGAKLNVFYSIPPQVNADSPIVIVIPGAKRNADQYRDQWNHLASANHFITLVVEAAKKNFPTEYEYNLGGVVDSTGIAQPEEKWLFSAIDPILEDFKKLFGSTRKAYNMYGHSAGGCFVHLFLLFKPDAKVEKTVAANLAFATIPDQKNQFPFGLSGAPIAEGAVGRWFDKRLVILLGERDRNPLSYPLSNSPEARLQGPHVFARGLNFFHTSLSVAKTKRIPINWQIEVVPDVGHSNTHMASYAVKYLLVR